MSLSLDAEAILADRIRVWEVRRYCQIANNPSRTIACGDFDHEPHTADRPVQKGDAALSALLRCLLYELDADIAAVTLLDDKTQYFLSVVQRSSLHDPAVTDDSSKWYSCASISHRGGLCARTITMEDTPGSDDVFEICDLSARDETKFLPVVDGSAASFRHYAGVPLKLAAGLKIGTLFVFKNEAAQTSLEPAHRHYMCETARHAVGQITQTVEALEAKQVLRCNAVVSSLANIYEPGQRSSPLMASDVAELNDQSIISVSEIYQGATSLLSKTFDLDSVIVQELPLSNAGNNLNQTSGERLLGSYSSSDTFNPSTITDSTANELLQEFPSGAILHLLATESDCGIFFASANNTSNHRKQIRLALGETLPLAEQIVFLPLWDTFHDRNVAFILAGTARSTRVLSSTADLSSLASFGATIMTQIRRLGAQTLERRKADFLGSISHEMRSPLHGILACIDLLLGEKCSSTQLDLLQSAESCGLQLRDNIDNLLRYSNIGSPSSSLTQKKYLRPLRVRKRQATSGLNTAEDLKSESFHILDLIEETIEKDARKIKGFTSSAERPPGLVTIGDSETEVEGGPAQPVYQTTIVVDVDPSAYFPLQSHSGIDVIIDSLLGNAIKFTDSTGCVRVSISSDSETTKLLFADSGRGISEDFVRHNLYVPFAQQDPLDAGTGLGLSLAHSVVKSLGGEIVVRADLEQGTEVLVTLPRDRLAESDNNSEVTVQQVTSPPTGGHSSMTVGLFSPTHWTSVENRRHQRGSHYLNESLAHTLKSWCNIDLIASASLSPETEPIVPDVLIVSHTDLQHLKEKTGDAYQKTQKIVLCPNLQAKSRVQESQSSGLVTVLGPVCPWKIRAAIDSCYRNITQELKPPQPHDIASETNTGIQNLSIDAEVGPSISIRVQGNSEFPANKEAPMSPPPTPFSSGKLELTFKPVDTQKQPRFLLVDDNIINLKVVGAYAKKCSKLPSLSAGGGRQAIDTFRSARSAVAGQRGVDIILLDLSMPEISGFEVAAAVRKMERSEPDLPRTYIAALTGLVSDKDREAAFIAGVDEYVTKPANLKVLQNVVNNWRNAKASHHDR